MKTLTNRAVLLLRTTATIAAIVFGAAAIAAVAGSWPASTTASAPNVAPVRRVGTSCAECGTVVSSLAVEPAPRAQVAGPTVKRYQVTVRMNDGSSRVFVDANLAHWRQGERVILIEAADRSPG